MTRNLLLAAALLVTLAPSVIAQLDDSLATLDHFAEPFGPLEVEALADGDGSASLTRQAGDADAGVDWLIDGRSDIPLDADHDQLTITPRASVGGGYYVASLLFFGQDGTFLAETRWVEDTNLATPQTLGSVQDFAAKHGVNSAARYRVRIRINPVGKQGAGFVFDRIAAVAGSHPEPE